MAAAVNAANLGAVTDPRLGDDADRKGSEVYDENTGRPFAVNVVEHGGKLSFEEYFYWAERARAYEANLPKAVGTTVFSRLRDVAFLGSNKKNGPKSDQDPTLKRAGSATSPAQSAPGNEKEQAYHETNSQNEKEVGTGLPPAYAGPTEDEWHTAARAARTATWGAVFYLITTDILGPFSVPWAASQLGFGPFTALYLVFAGLAAYSGVLLWKGFLGLDSERYPVKNYGDLAYRLFGPIAKVVCDILQSFQFFLGVTLLIISSGQSLSQMSAGPNSRAPLCFVACLVIMMAIGMLLGQIRTLQRFGYIANISVWLNLLTIFITMGVVANSGPNWTAVTASYKIQPGPIYHTAGIPPGKSLIDQINGLMQGVYSFGGATLFCELMAEMRRPWDFWKGLICADLLITACYFVFGLFVYGFQGQATFNPAYQGINPYSWQTVCNAFQLVTSMIAAALYGNIGIKVLYQSVGRRLLKFPALEDRVGKFIWVGFVPLYWALAFIIAAAVPQISYLSSFVGAAAIMQFSYTFPPAISIAFNIMKDTMGAYDPRTGAVIQSVQGESKMQRIWRGFKVQWMLNSFNVFYFLSACTTAILGLYASGVGMHQSYSNGSQIKAFSCDSPTG